VFIFQGCAVVWFHELHYREKNFTGICCSVQRNELHTGILNSACSLSGTCSQKLSVEWHWLKVFYPHFGQLFFYSRQVWNKRLANWTAITDTLTMNGFTRNAKHRFNSWKWSHTHLAWNSSSSLTICFSILPLCGLQLPLRETLVLIPILGKWQSAFDNMCLWNILIFFWEKNLSNLGKEEKVA